jgi:hypothetical protein
MVKHPLIVYNNILDRGICALKLSRKKHGYVSNGFLRTSELVQHSVYLARKHMNSIGADNFCNYEAPLRKEVEILKMNVADSFKVIDFLKRFYGRTR